MTDATSDDTRNAEEPALEGTIRLATQLVVLVGLVSVGPLFVTNLVGYLTSYNDTVELSLESLSRSAEVASLQTEQFVDEKRRLIASVAADNNDLKGSARATAGPAGTRKRDGRALLERHLRAKVREADGLQELYVVDSEGTLLGSSDRGRTAGDARVRSCTELLGGPRLYRFGSEADSAPFLVAHPLQTESGEDLGVLCGQFELGIGGALRRLAGSQKPGGTLLLVDREGRVLADSNRSGAHVGGRLDPQLTDRLDDSSWEGRYQDDADRVQFAALRPIGDTPWHIASVAPRREALQSLVSLKRRIIWLGGGLLLAVLLGMGLIVRTTIAPIRDLLEAVREMRQGDLDQEVEVRGPREVAELADAFNDMSRRVAELRSELEDRVRDRTEKLRHNQAFTELLFDSMEESLIVADDSMQIVKANSSAEQLYGDTLEGDTCHRVFEGRSEPCECCPVRRAIATGETVQERRAHECGDDSEIVDLHCFPLPDVDGERRDRVLTVGRVVTDEMRRERQLVHQEKMAAVGLLSAGMAHEIGNPLASIKSQLQAARHFDDPETMEETLEVVGDEVERIERLLRDVSDFARRRERTESRLSLNQVLEDLTRLLEHDPRGRNVDLEFNLAESLPPMRGAEDRVLQVLLNLGLNAIAAVDDGGSVTFETFADDEDVCIRVRDTGPGIPDEIRDRIFEPYFTTKSDGEGTGLGLYVSRHIVREMDGTLEVEETPEGAGASFLLRFPRADRPAPDGPESGEDRPVDLETAPARDDAEERV